MLSHQPPSCIDTIYTNVPLKMNNIETKIINNSNHKIEMANYWTNESPYFPKFIQVKILAGTILGS